MEDYSKYTDEELKNVIDPTINKGGIPLRAVLEDQKRNPRKYVPGNSTTTS